MRSAKPRVISGASRVLALTVAALLLASCQEQEAAQEPDRVVVEVMTAAAAPDRPTMSAVGEIRARVQSDLSFKVSGRVVERFVDVGDHVEAGTLLATIDPAEQKADVASAKAGVAAQEAQLRTAASTLQRQKALVEKGAVSRQAYDQADQEHRSAKSKLAAAEAALATAEDALSQTKLHAGAAGVVTARGIEVGQVVQPSSVAFTLAHDGPRDAVFNIQESIVNAGPAPSSIEIALISDPAVTASATVREVSPALDRATGTVRVKLGLDGTPAEMSLGAAVSGRVRMSRDPRVAVPWSALASAGGRPAVWIVDPKTRAVSLAPVAVARFDTDAVVLEGGVEPGALVVTAGTQFLRPGQIVALAEEPAR